MILKLVNYIGIAALVVGLSGCGKDTLNRNADGELDYSKIQPITLSSISTTISSEQEAEVKATTNTTPLAVGKTFRLYAFPKGVTDINKLITTRTYTISSVAGEPVLDPNQENLFLPIGDIDIFLVGPLKHDLNEGKIDVNNNPLTPDWVDVATPNGVEPRFGADLISSKTELNIKVGANQFQAQPLVHRMALMEVVVKRPTDAKYTDLNVTAISVMNQTLTGAFEFNATGGQITPADEGTTTLSPVIRTTIPNEEFRCKMYVIPRKNTQLRIGVFLTCKISGEEVDRRMESGIMTEPLVAGQMNRFITKPYLSDQLIFRLRLLPWDDVSAEDIEVPALGGMLFDYSGLDAPRLIDGKMCVPDRSGNNRHGELVGNIRYNAEEKYYYAATQGAYIKVPDLGKVPVYTLEITAASKRGALTVPTSFSDHVSPRTLSVHLPWEGNTIFFDAGDMASNRVSYNYSQNDLTIMDNLAVYAFTRTSVNAISIYRNGVLLTAKTGVAHDGLMTENKLLWWQQDNKLNGEFKMYAARMATNVNNAAIKNNYRNDIANFVGVTVDKEYIRRDYIEDGLILDLRGEKGYIVANGRYAWPDVSKTKNHALVMNTTTPTKGSNYYTFSGSQYMQLLHTLGALQNFTVEVVAKLGSGGGHTLLNFGHRPEGGDPSRQFSLHFPYNTIQSYSPYSTFNLSMPDGSLPYTYTYMRANPSQWSIARYNDGGKSFLEAWLNGGFAKSNSKNEIRIKELRYCFIGTNGPALPQYYNSSVYAIRVYDRVLTKLERQHNYQTDKVKYNLVP